MNIRGVRLSYVGITLVTTLLLIASLKEMYLYGSRFILLLPMTLLIFPLLFVKRREWLTYNPHVFKTRQKWTKDDCLHVCLVIIGSIITYTLSIDFDLGPILAAALVGMFSALFLPNYQNALYCGAFVGMSCSTFLPNLFCILLAGLLTGITYILSKALFNGFGGKLGAIALIGTLMTSFITGYYPLNARMPSKEILHLLIFYAILAAVLTTFFIHRVKLSPVLSSAIVSLSGTLLLTSIHAHSEDVLSLMVMCASFAGMSSHERIPNEGYMIVVALIAAVLFKYSQPFIDNAGGKLGTIAFASAITTHGLIQSTYYLQQQISAKKKHHRFKAKLLSSFQIK
ncbi:hypothetical protein [Amphibacillus cookii]|uniref:hypothetical protein n=1 Tax=Amphibacillus cookii TaxID=767787 RepID=UPI00195E93B8|nr:hypothetical protein [Amphibacillus cookii]MBM7541066.1 hypothetical protein [Amphibacillus cookii]